MKTFTIWSQVRALALMAGLIGGGMTIRCEAQTVTNVAAVRVATGLSQVLFICAPPGDAKRLFLVRQTGQVHILNLQTGNLNSTVFLDISARLTSTSGEQGLLGLAFDPDYATNGKFYLDLVVPGGAYGNGTTHISQFQVSTNNPDVADISNEKILVTWDHPYANHNGGWIGFSPRTNDDHNLYISAGDGGNSYDQGTGHIEPGGNAQNNTTLLGKMLRIHVNAVAGTMSIPTNNPFAGSTTLRQEVFAYGLRNPFRDSFDRLTGNLFIGDVGQDTREEVDVQPASNSGGGDNFGWRLREGTIQTSGSVGGAIPAGARDPILDYPRATGGTVIGGYVYRGRQIPALQGMYIFGDYLASKVFALNYNGATATNFQTITAQLFPTATGGFSLGNPASFGEDANGELYIADISSGSVFKIVPKMATMVLNSAAYGTNGHLILAGYGTPFQTNSVQATADLTTAFMTIGTVTNDGTGNFNYEDGGTAGLSRRFYRVRSP